MPEHDGLMRIFWPIDLPRSELAGVVVGWRNSGLDVFVVAILDAVDVSLPECKRSRFRMLMRSQPRNVEGALKSHLLFRNAPHSIGRMFELCGQAHMHVLGVSNASDTFEVDPSWVRVTNGPNMRVPEVRCAKASSIQIVLYQRPIPTRMQYISLNPISLALGDKQTGIRLPPVDDAEEEEEKQERKRKEKKMHLAEKLKQHSVIKRVPSAKEKALPKIVNQMNWAWELEHLLQKNVSKIGTRPKRSLSVSERMVESADAMKNYVMCGGR